MSAETFTVDRGRPVPVADLAGYVGEGRYVNAGDGAAGVLVGITAPEQDRGVTDVVRDCYLMYLRGRSEPVQLRPEASVIVVTT